MTARIARADIWFATLELAIGRRRVRRGPVGTGYRWRVATKPGLRAQYNLEHADRLALLEALELTGQAVARSAPRETDISSWKPQHDALDVGWTDISGAKL